jgi:hypothetical protein
MVAGPPHHQEEVPIEAAEHVATSEEIKQKAMGNGTKSKCL